MSPWQMRELLAELRKGRHSYVWLDALSIPAAVLGAEGKPGTWLQELSNTLVVRMMAVYAAASETLVLKSLEEEGGRYHQRGWTAQEYCVARSLTERVEPAPDAATAQDGQLASSTIVAAQSPLPRSASLPSEMEMFRTLRADAMQRMVHAVPVWLQQLAEAEGSDGVATGDDNDSILVAGALRYAAVRSKVTTGVPADKVRALVPLLFNSPVQGEEELKDLVVRSMNAVDAMATPSGEAVAAMQESFKLIGCDEARLMRSTTSLAGLPHATARVHPAGSGLAPVTQGSAWHGLPKDVSMINLGWHR